jgi:hypothetical protein
MPSHPYYPLVVAVLRRTLAQIEEECTPDDRALLELKASILRILARIEGPEPEDQPAA